MEFLQECKFNLKNADESASIHIVLGNEACDLDSAVSALVMAFLIHKLHPSEIVVPVLNVRRKELPSRTEVVFLLGDTGILLDNIICIDEIDLKELSRNPNVHVVLVDHNRPSSEQSYLGPRITKIIDHHAIEDPDALKDCENTIEHVGSCCTLVAEEFFKMAPEFMEPQIAMLLFGTILLDTVNMQEALRKTTPKDRGMVSELEKHLHGFSREEVFNALQSAKSDVSSLTPEQLLFKDTKYVLEKSLNIAIPSIPALLSEYLEDETFTSALDGMLLEKRLIAVVLLGTEGSRDGVVGRRQLAVFSKCSEMIQRLPNYLEGLSGPCLELRRLPSKAISVALYEQGDKQLSRKFVLPAIKEFLKSEHASGILEKHACPDFCEKKFIIENGYDLDYPENRIPAYHAETLDFPNSPKHSSLHDITVQLQDLSTCEETLAENEQADLDISKDSRSSTLKRKISVRPDVLEDDQKSLSSLSNKSDLDVFSPTDDIILPDDVDTLDELDNSEYLESSMSEPIPEMSAAEEFEEERSWKSCLVNGEERRIDMKVIEPYKKVLSHGGYEGCSRNAIIIFAACHLPDRGRKDYDYVMDNLFLYVISTLDQLIAEDYILVYLHGATERSNMPSFGWLKRCYQMIDRRLRKNLKGLYLVHPTFWLKTIVIMTRPFISSKFSRKLRFVYTLQELSSLVPVDHVCIPDKVKQLDFIKMIKMKKNEVKAKKIVPGPIYLPPFEPYY